MAVELPTAEVVAKYKAGWSLRRIGERYFAAPGVVRRVLTSEGVKMRQNSRAKTAELPIAEVVEEYKSGWSLRRLGAKYSVDSQIIRRTLVREGVEVRRDGGRPGYVIDLPMNVLVKEYETGSSIAMLARRYGVSYNTARSRLLDEGVELRHHGGWQGGSRRVS